MVLYRLFEQTGSIAEKFASVRKMYEVANIPNRVQDGKESFPEDPSTLRLGISVEFRNVSFKYPGSDAWALKDVSFKVERGKLCVSKLQQQGDEYDDADAACRSFSARMGRASRRRSS